VLPAERRWAPPRRPPRRAGTFEYATIVARFGRHFEHHVVSAVRYSSPSSSVSRQIAQGVARVSTIVAYSKNTGSNRIVYFAQTAQDSEYRVSLLPASLLVHPHRGCPLRSLWRSAGAQHRRDEAPHPDHHEDGQSPYDAIRTRSEAAKEPGRVWQMQPNPYEASTPSNEHASHPSLRYTLHQTILVILGHGIHRGALEVNRGYCLTHRDPGWEHWEESLQIPGGMASSRFSLVSTVRRPKQRTPCQECE
jgi:hypothetical protein